MELEREVDAKRVLRTSEFRYTVREHGKKQEVSVAISVSPHRTKNTSKGIINCFDLRDTPEEEIVDGLAPYGVVGARKFNTRDKHGQVVQTNNIVLTFNTVNLPHAVTVGYVRVPVRMYRSHGYQW